MMFTRRLFPLALLLAASLATAQNTDPAPPSSAEDKRFNEILLDVRNLASAQEYEQALAKLRDAEALKPDSPVVQNARGSVYTSMKDYEKARECFRKADSLKPGSFEPRFNLTELDYVQGNYEAASASFAKMLTAYPDLPMPARSLVQFKIIVCQIKLNKIADAKELAKGFAFAEKNPAGHFTHIAFAAQMSDFATADEWLTKARQTFGRGEIAPYVDALVEAGWLLMKGTGKTKE